MHTFRTVIASLIFITQVVNLFSTQEIPLIPREVLLSAPEKAIPQISPDGKRLAYCAPINNVLNIFVKTIGKEDDIALTQETKRPIFFYRWAYDNRHILYLQDHNGNENFHVYACDLHTNSVRDLTPFLSVKAGILALNKKFPHEVLITMNKENPKLFYAYHLDLRSDELTLVAKNSDSNVSWITDTKMQVRAAIQTHIDGKQSLLVRDHKEAAWRTLLTVDFEDTLRDEIYCGVLGFSEDGNHIYLNSSLGTNTRSLQVLNVETNERVMIARDEIYDLQTVFFDNDSHQPDIHTMAKRKTRICNTKSAFEKRL